jgi:hypothetical protein
MSCEVIWTKLNTGVRVNVAFIIGYAIFFFFLNKLLYVLQALVPTALRVWNEISIFYVLICHVLSRSNYLLIQDNLQQKAFECEYVGMSVVSIMGSLVFREKGKKKKKKEKCK